MTSVKFKFSEEENKRYSDLILNVFKKLKKSEQTKFAVFIYIKTQEVLDELDFDTRYMMKEEVGGEGD